MDLGNSGDINDYLNAFESWIGSREKADRAVAFLQFQGYKISGSANPNEQIKTPLYSRITTHAWLSAVRTMDTTVGGKFTTGDLDILTEFVIKGYQPATDLTNGKVLNDYAGDLIDYNGKLWEVADVLEPMQWGYQFGQVWYHTVMRRTNLTNVEETVGHGVR